MASIYATLKPKVTPEEIHDAVVANPTGRLFAAHTAMALLNMSVCEESLIRHFSSGNELSSIISRLNKLVKIGETEGFSQAVLRFVDPDNSLADYIPTCAAENFAPIPTKDASSEIAVEDIKSSIAGLKNKIVEWFGILIKKIGDYIESVATAAGRMKTLLEHAHKAVADVKTFDASKSAPDCPKFKDLMLHVDALTKAIQDVNRLPTNKPIEQLKADITTALKVLDPVVFIKTENSSDPLDFTMKFSKDGIVKDSKDTDTLSSCGYTTATQVASVITHTETLIQSVLNMKHIPSSLEKLKDVIVNLLNKNSEDTSVSEFKDSAIAISNINIKLRAMALVLATYTAKVAKLAVSAPVPKSPEE